MINEGDPRRRGSGPGRRPARIRGPAAPESAPGAFDSRRVGTGETVEQTVSERIAFIVDNDRMIPHFNMRVEEAREGYARVSARVEEAFLNVHLVAHGTLIFALLDVAFALAVNAADDAMGVQWSFNILRAAHPGEVLTAVCSTLHQGSRLHVVEYEVRNAAGRLLAKGQATAMPVKLRNPDAPPARATPSGS